MTNGAELAAGRHIEQLHVQQCAWAFAVTGLGLRTETKALLLHLHTHTFAFESDRDVFDANRTSASVLLLGMAVDATDNSLVFRQHLGLS